jgi:hypothetical protein
MLNGFGTVINSLGKRAKPYLPQICGTIKWRLNNKSAKIRQQAADLISRIAPVLKVGPCLPYQAPPQPCASSGRGWGPCCCGAPDTLAPRHAPGL